MTVRVHALMESSHLRPEGDGYAPQVVLTDSIHELNTDTLPFGTSWLDGVMDRFKHSHRVISGWRAHYHEACRVAERYFKIFWDLEVNITETSGHSKGDHGISLVFGTPEWLKMTGAYGVEEGDHNDFCAWLWGDVFGVFNDDPEQALIDESHPELSLYSEDMPLTVYGMGEAMKYGEITYPTIRSVVSYEY